MIEDKRSDQACDHGKLKDETVIDANWAVNCLMFIRKECLLFLSVFRF